MLILGAYNLLGFAMAGHLLMSSLEHMPIEIVMNTNTKAQWKSHGRTNDHSLSMPMYPHPALLLLNRMLTSFKFVTRECFMK